MLNGKLENSFISGQDKETLRRTRTERQNYEEISREFRKRIVKDLGTKELKALNQKSGASLLSIQAMMKVQGSYLRNIDNTLKKLVKINDNFIKALTKNMSLGAKINLGPNSARLGSYAVDNRANVLRDNKEYSALSKNISSFTDVIKELDRKQNERTNELLSVLSEVPSDISTNIGIAIDKSLRESPVLRKFYSASSLVAGSAFNWSRQGIIEMLDLPNNFSLGNLTKIVSWNTTGKWENEVRINKSLPLQTIISLLSSIQKQTWLINNDTLYNIQNGKKSTSRDVNEKGGLKRFADTFSPEIKKSLKGTLLASLLFPNAVGAPVSLAANSTLWLGTLIGKLGVSLLTVLGKGIVNYPAASFVGYTAVNMIYNRAKANAKRMADSEKKLNKMVSEAKGNWFNPDYETIKVGGKTLTEKDRSKTWGGYIKEEFTKGFWREGFTKGFGKTIGGMWKSIFNQDALRKEREANAKESEAKAIEEFKNNFLMSVAKRGKDVVDAVIGLKEMEYDIQLMRQQIVGKSNFNQIEEAKKNVAMIEALKKHAEEDKTEGTARGWILEKIITGAEKGAEKVKDGYRRLRINVRKGSKKVKNAYSRFKTNIGDKITEIGNIPWVNDIRSNIADASEKVKDEYGIFRDKIGDKITEIIDNNIPWANDIRTNAANASEKVKNVLHKFGTSAGDKLSELKDNIQTSKLVLNSRKFLKEWVNDEMYGTDRGKGILSLINGNDKVTGWLQQAKDELDEVNNSNSSKGENLYEYLESIRNYTRNAAWSLDSIEKSILPNAAGVIDFQGPEPANEEPVISVGKPRKRNFTNETDKHSLFYKLARDVRSILEILNDKLNSGKKRIPGWGDPIYYFAKGGMVNKPTLSMTGEAGPEGVFPLTKEVFQNFAKGIVSEMKGLEGSEYDIARKKGLPVLGAIIESALQTGVKTSWSLTKALSKDGYNFIKDLPSNMVNLTETIDAYDQEWTGKAQNFLGKAKEKFDVLDTFTDKLVKNFDEKVISKLSDNINEKIEDFSNVIDTNIQSISGNIKWSTAHLIHWFEETSKGKTYVGKKIIGFTNYLKEDLEKFKKKWKNTYGPILANPLRLFLGDNMKPITQVLGRMITPVLGGILAWYLMSPGVRRMATSFFQNIVPNVMKDGLWGGLRNTISDAVSEGPSYNEVMYDPEHKAQGFVAIGTKNTPKLLAGKVIATGAKTIGLAGKAAKGVGAVAYGTGKLATTAVRHTPFVSEAAKATMSKYFKTKGAKIVAKSNAIARSAKALATGTGKKIAGGVFGLGTTFAIDGAQLALSLNQLENAQTPEEMDAALREIAINQDRLKWDTAGAGAGGVIGGLAGAGLGALKGADWGSTIASIGFDVYNWATDAKSYKLSDDDFLKEKASIYGIKDISSMDAKQKKLLRALILQIECKPATDKMTPVQLESLKYDIAALANSKYIVKATKDGKFELDISFTKDYYKSKEFKDISKAFEQYKERKQFKRVRIKGEYGFKLSNDIFKGDISQELEKMILWLKNEYSQIYLRCFEELPDQRKAVYLNLWMDWRYPKEGQKFIPERGLLIAESIKREGQEINRKNKLGKVKKEAMAPVIKSALPNSDTRDGADTYKMTIKMKNNRNLNIFGNTSKPNSNTNALSTVVGGVIGGPQVSSSSAPAMPKSPNSIAEKLATSAQNVAWSMGKYKSQSKCTRGVKRALVDAGILKEYPFGDNVDEAWKMADYFTKTGKFYEITSKFNNKEDIVQAPRGSIIVWGKSPTKKYGHIEVALGNGKTASDFLWNVNSLFETEKRNNKYYGPARIFYPIGEGDNISKESSGGLYNGIKNFFSGFSNTITNSQAYKTVSDKLGEAKEIAEEKYNTYVPKSARDTINSFLVGTGNTLTDIKKFYNENINPSMKRAADAAWAETTSSKNWGNEYRQFSLWNPLNLISSGESLDQDSLGQIQGDVQAVYDKWSKKYGYYNDSKEARESWERQINKLGPGQKAFAEMYFQKLSRNANPIMTKYNEMKTKFEDMFSKTSEVAAEVGNQLLEKSNEIAIKGNNEAKKSSEEVVTKLNEIKEVLVEKEQATKQAIVNNVSNIKNSSEYKTISNSVSNMIDSVSNGANDMFSGIMNLIDNFNS